MNIESDAIISGAEANQSFSHMTRIAEEKGSAVIFKNDRPKHMLIDLDSSPSLR